MAAFAEMLDHTETNWIYINRLSGWNGLFYAGLAGGLASLTASVTANKTLRVLLYALVIAGIAAYPLLGKGITISLQSIITIIFPDSGALPNNQLGLVPDELHCFLVFKLP